MAADCSALERLLSELGDTSQVCESLDGRQGSTQINHIVIQKGLSQVVPVANFMEQPGKGREAYH